MEEQGNEHISVIVVTILGALAIAGWLYFVVVTPNEQTMTEKSAQPTQAVRGDERTESASQVLSVRHQYNEGTHSFAGEIPVPTNCHSLTTQGIVDSTKTPENIILNLRSLENGSCKGEENVRMFLISLNAEKDALIAATLNSQNVSLNLVEVPAGEKLVVF